MKNKLMLTALLGLLLVGSFAYAEESDDEAKKRLLKEYEKVQKEREKEAEMNCTHNLGHKIGGAVFL